MKVDYTKWEDEPTIVSVEIRVARKPSAYETKDFFKAGKEVTAVFPITQLQKRIKKAVKAVQEEFLDEIDLALDKYEDQKEELEKDNETT